MTLAEQIYDRSDICRHLHLNHFSLTSTLYKPADLYTLDIQWISYEEG